MGEPSAYEISAWQDLHRQRSRPATRAIRATGDKIVQGTSAVGSRFRRFADQHPRVANAQQGLSSTAQRARQAVPDGATSAAGSWLRSASESSATMISKVGRTGLSPDRLVARHQARGHGVSTLSDIRRLDLRQVDVVRGRRMDYYYPAAGAASGAGAGLLITGGDLMIVVSGGAAAAPGAGVVAGTMIADASVVLTLAARAVGQVALAYGYDPEEPGEKIFALSVVNLGTSLSSAAKYTAMADISKLTQALFRGATWKTINSSIVSQLYLQFAARFGVRVTKQSLGKVVPVVGIALGAGFNWATLEAVVDAAQVAYRRRFLLEKYPQLADSEAGPVLQGHVSAEDDVIISVIDELARAGGPDIRDDETVDARDDENDDDPGDDDPGDDDPDDDDPDDAEDPRSV